MYSQRVPGFAAAAMRGNREVRRSNRALPICQGLGREYYSAQTGATEEEANIAVALVSDHSLVKWAGIMGLITA